MFVLKVHKARREKKNPQQVKQGEESISRTLGGGDARVHARIVLKGKGHGGSQRGAETRHRPEGLAPVRDTRRARVASSVKMNHGSSELVWPRA
jgi:hypothetical protein